MVQDSLTYQICRFVRKHALAKGVVTIIAAIKLTISCTEHGLKYTLKRVTSQTTKLSIMIGTLISTIGGAMDRTK